jgi:hypothetical protein
VINANIFDEDTDSIIVGSTTPFDRIVVTLETLAGSSIYGTPATQYSRVATGWVNFTPTVDGTTGFTSEGTFELDAAAMLAAGSPWAPRAPYQGPVGASVLYWVRINRNEAVIGTEPVIGTLSLREYPIPLAAIHGMEADTFLAAHDDNIIIDVINTSVIDVEVHNDSLGLAFCDSGLIETTGPIYTDITSSLRDPGTHTTMFVSNGDRVYIGHSSRFGGIRVDLQLNSTHDIQPTFEYSQGGGVWKFFGAVDNTNGFTAGLNDITWIRSQLEDAFGNLDWEQDTVDGNTMFWIRITRTAVTVTGGPTDDTFRLLTIPEDRILTGMGDFTLPPNNAGRVWYDKDAETTGRWRWLA